VALASKSASSSEHTSRGHLALQLYRATASGSKLSYFFHILLSFTDNQI
jgi:hypothetical protein